MTNWCPAINEHSGRQSIVLVLSRVWQTGDSTILSTDPRFPDDFDDILLGLSGHVPYLKRKDRSLQIGYRSDSEGGNEAETEILPDLIEAQFQPFFTEEPVPREIHFGGAINRTRILLDALSISKYVVDKDHQDLDIPLFRHKSCTAGKVEVDPDR